MKLKVGDDFYNFDLFDLDSCRIMADRLDEAGRNEEARILRWGMPPCWHSKERRGMLFLPTTNSRVEIEIHQGDCLVGEIAIGNSEFNMSTVNCSENQEDGPSAALLILCHHLLHGSVTVYEFLQEIRVLLPLRRRGNLRRQVSRTLLHDNIQEALGEPATSVCGRG